MQMPLALQAAIEEIAANIEIPSIRTAHSELSEAYRRGEGSHFRNKDQTIAYLLARMPATYAAVFKALLDLRERLPEWTCKTLLDLGAGPGTASWAASEIFPLQTVHLFEKSFSILSLGRKLAAYSETPALKSASWSEQDLTRPFELPKADLAILSYVLAETDCTDLIQKLILQGTTLLIVEPGTPKGFSTILALRKKIVEWGAYIAAPCPHQGECPMSSWCHFPARVERTKIHKILKEGSMGYEDEKFSYLAVTPFAPPPLEGRLVEKPLKLSGHVKLTLCTKEGTCEQRTISRKQKELYRQARDAEWSSPWM
ncbi:MAG: hypothetical protein JSS32_01415 [Verrucomicrobia bacterium]|nr:hypothetical protein [Verrucomicrobiota bacterium]